MKRRMLLQPLIWLSLMMAANALAQGRSGSHGVTGHVGSAGFSGGHYAYVGGFHSSFYWGGFGFGFSFGWPYYSYGRYPYYTYSPYPYYSYYGYPYWWVPRGHYVWGAPYSRYRGDPSQTQASNSRPPADADGEWHKFGESDYTPTPRTNSILASARTNELAAVTSSHRSDGEWHRFGESK